MQDFILVQVVLNISMPWGSVVLKFATHILRLHKVPPSPPPHQCTYDGQKNKLYDSLRQLTFLTSSTVSFLLLYDVCNLSHLYCIWNEFLIYIIMLNFNAGSVLCFPRCA